MKENAIIFDLDGTLCDDSHRVPYILNNPTDDDWKKYHSNCIIDRPISFVRELLMDLHKKYYIFLLTGRDEAYRKETIKWLTRFDIKYDELLMRPNGMHVSSHEFKLNIYETHIREDFNIICVFEDRKKVVKMWRDLGLLCLQVQDND